MSEQVWLATSTDGGQTFGPNIRVSDGNYAPTGFGFLGDYIGASTGGGKLFPLWPDGRNGNPDVFAVAVDTADFDKDAILNDGNGDGQYANLRCSGDQTVLCDDNCPGTPNPAQADGDGDLVGDACDNCPAVSNTNQHDLDQDAIGDSCDACPGVVGGDASDPDLDGRGNCIDNCPNVSNTVQANADGDAFGDLCDPCPLTATNDADGDFPLATGHVSARELEAFSHPRTLVERRAYRPEHTAHSPRWQVHDTRGAQWFGLEAASPTEVGGSEIVFVPMPGHTRGHCALAVRAGDRWLLHCGDSYGYYRQADPVQPYEYPNGRLMEWAVTAGFSMPRRHWRVIRQLLREHGDVISAFCSHDAHEFAAARAEKWGAPAIR